MNRDFLLSITRLNLALLLFTGMAGQAIASKLDTLFARGDSSINISWTPDDRNTATGWYVKNGAKCTGADTVYRHSDFKPGVTYKSIAYSYGGEDSYLRFREKITNGLLAGSHMCHYNVFGDPSGVIAGTDCSGFVCYLWNVPRVETGKLQIQYTVISRDKLDVGDILVKPGNHAVIIIEHDEGTRYLIWESTSVVNGCRERIIDLADSYWDGYYPRRYEGLTAPVLQVSGAFRSGSFPEVKLYRNTLQLVSSNGWSGIVTAHRLDGRNLFQRSLVITRQPHVLPESSEWSGCTIISLKGSDGTECAIPLFLNRN